MRFAFFQGKSARRLQMRHSNCCMLAVAACCGLWACNGGNGATPRNDAGADAQGNRGDGFFTWAIVEKFTHYFPRSTVPQTMAGLIVFHEGENATEPSVDYRDEHCFAYSGLWTTSGENLPTFGKVLLRGAKEGERELTAQPNFYGYGTPLPIGEDSGWDEGDVMRMTAPGDQLPGFDESAVVPKAPTLTTFDITTAEKNGYTIYRDRPLTLSWIPQSGEVQIFIVQFRQGDGEAVKGIRCAYPGEGGQGTIPQSLMGGLLPADGLQKTNLYFEGLDRVTTKIERMSFELAAFNGFNFSARIE
jgi:hypothetical protein